VISRDPEIEGVFTIVGFGAPRARPRIRPSSTPVCGHLKIAREMCTRPRQRLHVCAVPSPAVSGAIVVPFNPPAVQGLGQFGGFQFELEDLGRNSLQSIAQTANKLAAEGNVSKDIVGLFTSFTANDPQYLVRIDREKAKSLQVPLSQISNALQVYMGSVYAERFRF